MSARLASRPAETPPQIGREAAALVQGIDFIRKIGAGDAIRTHDLNLGKVSLYP